MSDQASSGSEYFRTNIPVNAMTGTGEATGKVDQDMAATIRSEL